MTQRHGLGKGLGALIPESTTTRASDAFFDRQGDSLKSIPGASFAEIQISQIIPNRNQPRVSFDDSELEELKDSISEVGVLQPIVVRMAGDNYELIMGERRTRASKLAGKVTIPAIIRTTQDNNMLRDALIENMHRADLNPLEEAAAYRQMMDDFGLTQDELSKKLSKSRPQITNMLRLLRLPAKVQKLVETNQLSFSAAKVIMSIENQEKQLSLAETAANQNLSIKQIEEIAANPNNIILSNQTPKPNIGIGKLPGVYEVSQDVGDWLDTKVDISFSRNKGKLTIHFSNGEDLNRILKIIAPGVEGTPWS